MILGVSRLRDNGMVGAEFSYKEAEALLSDRLARFKTALSCKVKGEKIGEDIHVSLSGSAELAFDCDRCLEDVDRRIELDVSETFFLNPADKDSYSYDGSNVELDELITEAFLNAVPNYVLCREDCKGICQHCGIDLNVEMCKCTDTVGEETNPFTALKNIK